MEEDNLEGTIEVDYKIHPLLYDEDEDGEKLGKRQKSKKNKKYWKSNKRGINRFR